MSAADRPKRALKNSVRFGLDPMRTFTQAELKRNAGHATCGVYTISGVGTDGTTHTYQGYLKTMSEYGVTNVIKLDGPYEIGYYHPPASSRRRRGRKM